MTCIAICLRSILFENGKTTFRWSAWRVLAKDGPIAKAGRIGATRPRFDERPMLDGVGPGTGNEPGDLRLAIHGEAGVRIGELARAYQQAIGFEG
jgi:hypothetical protein